ncbi:MAG: hypothetical protein KME43_19295 [Myxacorys chilensis ATA2-1-KO14]|jgi:hypothetical protein|nr:hypothetical protein [Myxacorys chilensis ATA2-1-KO14]
MKINIEIDTSNFSFGVGILQSTIDQTVLGTPDENGVLVDIDSIHGSGHFDFKARVVLTQEEVQKLKEEQEKFINGKLLEMPEVSRQAGKHLKKNL